MTRRIAQGGTNFSLVSQGANGRWWTWATAAARNATVVTDADLGKTGYQSDMALSYRLLSQTGGVGRWARLPWVDTLPIRQVLGGYADTALTAMGHAAAIVSGTGTAVVLANTSFATRRPRVDIASAAGAGSIATVRGSTIAFQPLGGGLRFCGCIVLGAITADMRWFAGITATFPGSNVDPADGLNVMGIGRSGSGENVQVMHNDGSGTCTKLDQGASFPGATAGTGYEFEAYTPDGTTWGFQTRAINTGAELSQTITLNLPADLSSFMTFYGSNNGTASAIRIGFSDFQVAPIRL